MRQIALLGAMLLSACSIRSGTPPAEEIVSPCEPVMFEDSPLTHCTADPTRHTIEMAVGDTRGKPFRSFRTLAAAQTDDAAPVVMAMNGGMFDTDGLPIGYYVEDGERTKPVNQAEGPGNFHLLPNGIFYGQAGGPWQVRETEAFVDTVKDRPEFATQSGPMLVVGGRMHPDFDDDGASKKVRNGIGVDLQGRAHFVISEAPVSFGKLARFYRDVLKVENALFLDGSVSQLWDPARGRMDQIVPLGPLIVVRRREDASQ